jgi:hypothetical protein
MKDLFPYISAFRQRAVAAFHRTDPLKASSDERRKRWSEVIAEHRAPLKPQKHSDKATQCDSRRERQPWLAVRSGRVGHSGHSGRP